MTKTYIKEAVERAERASDLAGKIRELDEAMEVLPKDDFDIESILHEDPSRLQVVIYLGDLSADHDIIKVPVPAADQMRVYAMMKTALQERHAEAAGMLLRELSSDASVN